MSWREQAKASVDAVMKTLPDDTTIKDARKALRASYPFYERLHYPYKVWLEEVAKALANRYEEAAPKDAKPLLFPSGLKPPLWAVKK